MADRYVCVYPVNYDYELDEDEDLRYSAGYPSLAAAESAEDAEANITLNNGDILYIDYIHGSDANVWDGNPDTTQAPWDGWACSNGSKVVVRTLTTAQAANGVSSRPDFSSGAMDTSEVILQTATNTLYVDNDHDAGEELSIDFIGLQVSSTGNSDAAVYILAGAQHDTILLEKCWLQQTSNGYGLRNRCNDSSTVNVINCVMDGDGANDAHYAVLVDGTSTTNVYNCTAHNFDLDAMFRSGGTLNVVNCNVGNNVDDWEGTIGGQYNCSDDGDGPGTDVAPVNGADDWTGDLTTPWTNLNVKDVNANIYLGSPISQADDALVPADDIMGTARLTGAGQSVCIGAYEFAAAGVTVPPLWHHLNKNIGR